MTINNTSPDKTPRRINDMDSCRVPTRHAHTKAETRDVDFFATRRGIIDLPLFKRVHCSPAARKKFRRDWGVDPIWTDMEDFFEQMYWLRRRSINKHLHADVREPNIFDLHFTLRGLTRATLQVPCITPGIVSRPHNGRSSPGTACIGGWDATVRSTQHKPVGVLSLPATESSRGLSAMLGTGTLNLGRARARTTAIAFDATLLAVRGTGETPSREVELCACDCSRPNSAGVCTAEQR